MMTIKTYLKPVDGKGLGLFTAVDIKKDDVVYIDETMFSKIITNDEVKTLPPCQQKFIHTYASYMEKLDKWFLCLDNARFFNHDNFPNTTYTEFKEPSGIEAIEGFCYANCNIPADTELTADYREFDGLSKKGEFGFEII